MRFLVVLCEGHAEMDFVSQVLSEHLSKFGTKCHPILLGKKIKHDIAEAPGGVFKYEPVRRHIMAALRQYSAVTSYVTTMVDLYAFPTEFPKYEILAAEPDANKRVKAFEGAMHNETGRDNRFVPHIQLHEFEALIYSKLDELRTELASNENALRGLDKLIKDVEGLEPEAIDQTKEGAPSKRLEKFIPSYDKRTMGPVVIQRIGWSHLKTSCPHFGAWITRLENL